MEAHDTLIFLAPALLHLFELGLANHVLDARREMPRHSADPADPIADRPHDPRQFLRANEDEREDRDDRELRGIKPEHDEPEGLAGLVVSRRRCRVGRPRSHVDRLLRTSLVAWKLARRLVPALVFITANLFIILVGHALLEALEALRDVPHHRREAVSSE